MASHKQSRIMKEISATVRSQLFTSDPAERKKLKEHYYMLQDEWMKAEWESRFPHHDMNGNLIDNDEQ